MKKSGRMLTAWSRSGDRGKMARISDFREFDLGKSSFSLQAPPQAIPPVPATL
jgi:hypothetical protein